MRRARLRGAELALASSTHARRDRLRGVARRHVRLRRGGGRRPRLAGGPEPRVARADAAGPGAVDGRREAGDVRARAEARRARDHAAVRPRAEVAEGSAFQEGVGADGLELDRRPRPPRRRIARPPRRGGRASFYRRLDLVGVLPQPLRGLSAPWPFNNNGLRRRRRLRGPRRVERASRVLGARSKDRLRRDAAAILEVAPRQFSRNGLRRRPARVQSLLAPVAKMVARRRPVQS